MVYNVRGMKVSADNWDVCADQSIKRELIRLGFADKGGLFCFNARKKTAAVVDARCFDLPDKALGLAARLAQVRNVAVYVVTGEEEAFISASRLAVLRGGGEAPFRAFVQGGDTARKQRARLVRFGRLDGLIGAVRSGARAAHYERLQFQRV